MEPFKNYCTQCRWEATTDDRNSRREVNERAIEHYCEYGHEIRSLTLKRSLNDWGPTDDRSGSFRVSERPSDESPDRGTVDRDLSATDRNR